MTQRLARASARTDDNVLRFPRPSDAGAVALDLVHQAAEVFRSMEDQARESEARAQSLCKSAMERLRRAETRAEAAERTQRDIVISADDKLRDASRALKQAQSRIDALQDQLAALEFRAEAAEAEASEAKHSLALVEEAIRRRLLCVRAESNSPQAAVA